MKIAILGGGGFLGRKLATRLARDGRLGDQPVTGLTLFDLATPPKPDARFPVTALAGDIVDLPAAAVPAGTDVVFHLAAVVSAQAEADYDLGRRVNLRGTDAVVDACRRQTAAGGRPPRVVFTSSVASFSGGQDAVLDDDARQVPSNSYGAQKAAAELILADASRRGFIDAVSIRLPTVIVRPGRPNRAASSFFSAIVREPLLGQPADLPVPDAFAAWVCSPRRAVDWLLHAAAMDTAAMGLDRSINATRHQHHDRAPAAGARRGEAGCIGAGPPRRGPGHRVDRRSVAAGLRADARPYPGLCRARAGGRGGTGLRRGRPGGNPPGKGPSDAPWMSG